MLKYSIRCAAVILALAVSASGYRPVSLAAQGPEVVRRVLLQQDLPVANYQAVELAVDLPPGSREGRHSHSGVLIVHVLEGSMSFDLEGNATTTYNAGDTFAVETGQIHEGINNGSAGVKLIATLIFPKDQPATTPAP